MCMGGGNAPTPTGSTVLPTPSTPAAVIPVVPPAGTKAPSIQSDPGSTAPTTAATTGLSIPGTTK